ncbi:right-handed parallel beta-helix repeat-containing protein [Rubellicoccus peritrichatus]|uniref:Right-handed parallel beta-helix repeat-containing protein n=1 Tax=Rubellicoccus peritrichatus TaxID=3080537 RepID=A0AAQ3QUP6_9BACT|nr:right-handed parallel beta-helix repeat-containing protein [Puniceicoccus sp. CR14]WOO40623.1 right-handed parallel beta-helix repeat-containing protein [Puniceicoccus sp. CR14]
MIKKTTFAAFCFAGLLPIASAKTLSIADFGAKPGGPDTIPALKQALAAIKKEQATKLIFPSGTYHFFPDYADERYCFISNNDEGLKRIAFNLKDFENLEIDGNGSLFMFHGKINPVILEGSSNIRLKNFAIDFKRSFHSEGVIVADPEEGLDLRIDPTVFPYEIAGGILTFTDGDQTEERKTTTKSKKITFPYGGGLEFDPEKKEPAYLARDLWVGPAAIAKPLGDGVIRIMDPKLTGTPGNIFIFGPSHREHPGIVISRSQDTVIEDITIHHAAGMALIAQLSHNVQILRMKTGAREGSGRLLSATADATHFSNCTGKIEIGYCNFQVQKDDPSNLHGLYARISAQEDDKTFVIEMIHPQQYGIDFVDPNDELEFVNSRSLVTYGTGKVASVERINKQLTRVVMTEAVPKDFKVGDAIAEIRDYPEIHIHNCRMHGNRARGLLLNCRGKTLIEDNHFHVPGTAILFESDASFWYEQGGVRDCTIRGNVFENGNFGPLEWGTGVIEVRAGIEDEFKPSSRYNQNITIEDNTFILFDRNAVVRTFSVDGLTIRNNTIIYSEAYPNRGLKDELFDISYSDNVVIENNKVQELPENLTE